jgi:Rho GDP-dissociation inhibitor
MSCPDRPKGNIVFDLQKVADGSHKVANEYILKEGSFNSMELRFKVHNDIVHGLKYCYNIRKGNIIVEKDEENVGSYAPTKEPHKFSLKEEEVPSGWLKRGAYNGKAMLIDLDGIVHF